NSHALDPLRAVIGEQWDRLSPAERAVCRHLLDAHPQQLLFASAQELGSASGTSNATVVRTMQRLGHSGLSALKQEIAAAFSSEVAPEVRLAERLERVGQDLAGAWDRIVDEARERLEHCRAENDAATLEEAVKLLAGAREVVAYGTAASEHAARHLARKLNRLGARARAVDSTWPAWTSLAPSPTGTN
ncbi:MAG: transcriptional regulator, partial [Streptosporangiales bacterium]|nr:transcriptional regulator [Streptosporangiales bacterium]